MDEEYRDTDKRLRDLEKRLKKEYEQAAREAREKMDAYMESFKKKDAAMYSLVKDGKMSTKDYAGWRMGQIMVGQRWQEMVDVLAWDYEHTNDIARQMIYGEVVEAYANNYNFGLYEIESAYGIDTSLVLYDKHAVEYLATKDPQLLPMPSPKRLAEIKTAGGVLWNKQQIQSVMMQSILQGESIPQIAKRLATEVGEKNYHAAVRNARTMTTAASNAGRTDAYIKGEEMGIEGKRQWVAVLDARTRHAHRQADGQLRGAKEPFEVDGYEMQFPADKNAPAYLVYNCRCGIKYIPARYTPTAWKTREVRGYSSYEEWKNSKAKYETRKKKEGG